MSDETRRSMALKRATRRHYTIWNNNGKLATHTNFKDALAILKYHGNVVYTSQDAVRMLRDASSIGAIKRGNLTIVACGI